MANKNIVQMTYHTVIMSSKTIDGETKSSKINIKGIKEIEELLPDQDGLRLWMQETVLKSRAGLPVDLIHIKVIPELYEKIIKKVYFKIGKNVELLKDSKVTFRIPVKSNNVFFEDIIQLVLFSNQLRTPIIVIHI